MATDGNVDYIGSQISLISKNDIRYEGILFTLDTEQSTIALQNVRSLGTEDRKTGIGAVPASNQTFDYIIFRAADIKDLNIIGPAPAPAGDPAIIAASGSHVSTMAMEPPPPVPPPPVPAPPYSTSPWGPPTGAAQGPPPGFSAPVFAAQPTSMWAGPQPPQATLPPPAVAAPPPTALPVAAPAPTMAVVPAAPPRPPGAGRPQPRANQSQPAWAQARGAPMMNGTGPPPRPAAQGDAGMYGQHPRQPQPRAPMYANAAYGGPRGRGPRTGMVGPPMDGRGRGRGGPPPGGFPPRAPPVAIPTEEFDYVKMNEQFDKIAIVKEAEQKKEEAMAEDANGPAYQKDDFFDRIGCEALDRLGGPGPPPGARARFAEQRKVDIETFGGTGVAHPRGYGGRRGRGRGRGGQGRGPPRDHPPPM